MPRLSRLLAVALVLGLLLSGCSLGGSSGQREYHAVFSRAVQLFPAGRVRVLGVNVGHIVSIENRKEGVEVTFRIDRSDIQLPTGVQAAIVPASLLGERYVQLFPAYESGPALPPGSTIPESRTAVPAEPDELLRSLQDYLGALDPNTVTTFVENAAKILQGNGDQLNTLIQNGASVMETLSSKGDDLATLITELDKLTTALATRQQAIGQLIRTYDTVGRTLNDNRSSVEGTIQGLNSASAELASLLIAHKSTLGLDVDTLTRTSRTLTKNVGQLADTGHYATLLFQAASRAVDYDHNWLRLGNQGAELAALILLRLQERLQAICVDLGIQICIGDAYWAQHAPSLFCYTKKCSSSTATAAKQLSDAIANLPKLKNSIVQNTKYQPGTNGQVTVTTLVDALLQQTIGNSAGLGGKR
jgi:phospholipid/cholesterol/gamma-HCH transport system substrate-binding protein